jgi:pyrroline-5-carboxylate reductase
VFEAKDICVYDVNEQVRATLSANGYAVAANEGEVVASSKIVILAVRPSDVRPVLEQIRDSVTFNNVLVSLAAGVPMSVIKKTLGKECKLIRVIPNVAARYGKGVTAMAYEMPLTYQELQSVKDLFEAVGILRIVEEDRLNDFIAATSSSAAYFYLMVRAIAEGAAAQGIDPDTAAMVAAQAFIGASAVMEHSDKTAEELLSEVATPRGTTAEALNLMEQNGFSQIMADAMLACTKRANTMDAENEAAQG